MSRRTHRKTDRHTKKKQQNHKGDFLKLEKRPLSEKERA